MLRGVRFQDPRPRRRLGLGRPDPTPSSPYARPLPSHTRRPRGSGAVPRSRPRVPRQRLPARVSPPLEPPPPAPFYRRRRRRRRLVQTLMAAPAPDLLAPSGAGRPTRAPSGPAPTPPAPGVPDPSRPG